MSKKEDCEKLLIGFKKEASNKRFNEEMEIVSIYANKLVKLFDMYVENK